MALPPGHHRILLVDDSMFARMQVLRILKRYGFEIVEVDNVDKAVEKLREQTFDIVISDYLMPGKFGESILDEMHDLKISVPVIFLTADLQQTTESILMGKGARAVLHKPVNGTDLIDTMQAVFRADS
ncbi:response regulator [bacterium]|nr:response regulator [bacterium]